MRNPDPASDPSNLESAFVGFADPKGRLSEADNLDGALRYSWLNHAETLRSTPLRLRYEQLDPNASYRVRVVYGGDSLQKPIRLVANDAIEIHPLMPKPQPIKPVEIAIPRAATAKGELTLSWNGDATLAAMAAAVRFRKFGCSRIRPAPAESAVSAALPHPLHLARGEGWGEVSKSF